MFLTIQLCTYAKLNCWYTIKPKQPTKSTDSFIIGKIQIQKFFFLHKINTFRMEISWVPINNIYILHMLSLYFFTIFLLLYLLHSLLILDSIRIFFISPHILINFHEERREWYLWGMLKKYQNFKDVFSKTNEYQMKPFSE